MNFQVYLSLCCLFSTGVLGRPSYDNGNGGAGGNQVSSGGMPYKFEWTVKDDATANDFGHGEQSDGQVVQGMYFVLLPDGRRQTVTYRVEGNSGYVADVQYEGEARFPPSTGSGGGVNAIGGVGGGNRYN